MLQKQQRDIGGTTFEVHQLPARRSLRLIARLGKVLGPVLTRVAGILREGGKVGDLQVEKLAPVLGGLFEALPPAEAESLFEEILASTHVVKGGRPVPLWPVVDIELQGRTLDLFKVAAFALEVNYADFFDALRAAAPPADEGSKSPST